MLTTLTTLSKPSFQNLRMMSGESRLWHSWWTEMKRKTLKTKTKTMMSKGWHLGLSCWKKPLVKSSFRLSIR